MLMEFNENVNKLEEGIGEIIVTITSEMCRQVMLSVRRRLQLRARSGDQHFGHTCKVASLRFRHRGTPTCFVTGPLRGFMLAAEVWVHHLSEMMTDAAF